MRATDFDAQNFFFFFDDSTGACGMGALTFSYFGHLFFWITS